MTYVVQRSILSVFFLGHLLCSAADPLSPAQAKLATEAHQVLINYCGKCHGKGGSYSDEMLLDHKLLLKEEFVLAGKADKSDLYTKIAEGDMPPKKQNPVPADKLTVIKQWIDGGAPDWNLAPQEKREFVSTSSVIDSIVRDLEKRPKLDRQFVRYYTLTHLYNAGESEDALGNYRIALSKLVNSLSWETEITNPVVIDSQKTILRLDLRDYGWTKDIWKKITANYPYAINYPTKNYESLRNLTTADVPFLRTDWFISTAGLPPLYHDILELPNTDKELEDKLNVDVRRNLRDSPGRRVWRSGFLESGVSKFNRIVERHTSPYGAYWKSYDFDSNNGLKNIFQNPIGFKHAGGEIIFNLPNGLQAYLLADSAGRRINEAPVNIVFTDQGTDPIIRNGLTCMSCHTAGMKEFKDRAGELHLAIQATPFDVPDEKEYALALYPDAATINKLVGRDKQKFEEAVSKLGGVAGGKEPIALLTERYEEPLGSKLTAAELGIAEAEFISKLKGHELLKSTGLNTLAAGGTIARETWEELFPLVVTSLGAGDPRFNNDQFRKFNKTLSAVERRKWIEETLKGGDRQGGAARITITLEEYLKFQKQLQDDRRKQAAFQQDVRRKQAAFEMKQTATLKQIAELQTQFKAATDKAERDRIIRELAEAEKRVKAAAEAAKANSLVSQPYEKSKPQGGPFIGFGTINSSRVSARGKATIFSALVFWFNKNEPVNIIEEINIANPKSGEPRKWLRVQVPADAGVWVHADFLGELFKKTGKNSTGQPIVYTYAKVKSNLLNVRSGASEHFPILGKLTGGSTVQVTGRRNDVWVELFAPANCSVYVPVLFVTRIPVPIDEQKHRLEKMKQDKGVARYKYTRPVRPEDGNREKARPIYELTSDGQLKINGKIIEPEPIHKLDDYDFISAQYKLIKSEIDAARRLEWMRRGVHHYATLAKPGAGKSEINAAPAKPGAEEIKVELTDDGQVKINGKIIEPNPKKEEKAP